jgi:hypothetical protein
MFLRLRYKSLFTRKLRYFHDLGNCRKFDFATRAGITSSGGSATQTRKQDPLSRVLISAASVDALDVFRFHRACPSVPVVRMLVECR